MRPSPALAPGNPDSALRQGSFTPEPKLLSSVQSQPLLRAQMGPQVKNCAYFPNILTSSLPPRSWGGPQTGIMVLD